MRKRDLVFDRGKYWLIFYAGGLHSRILNGERIHIRNPDWADPYFSYPVDQYTSVVDLRFYVWTRIVAQNGYSMKIIKRIIVVCTGVVKYKGRELDIKNDPDC